MSPPRHDRSGIVESTLRLLDEVGLPDLSMRRLATALEVQPSALYWHFPSKQALLAAVAERILVAVPDADDGRELMDVALAIHDALLAFRDGAEVVMSTYALRLGADRAQRALAASLPPSGTRDALADAVFEFILGHVTLLQQRMHAQSVGAVTADAADPAARAMDVFRAGIHALSGINAARRPS
ncbi:TetR family transcriptional regulator [Microbacterium sp. USHLN186]|uniref:TetR family transcriptional regulator n=1 Tax=Microbacterium sp. USHLN186 TaxID=3081286 RepID=UPI0030194C8E